MARERAADRGRRRATDDLRSIGHELRLARTQGRTREVLGAFRTGRAPPSDGIVIR